MSKSEKKVTTPKKKVTKVEVAKFLSDRDEDYLKSDKVNQTLKDAWGNKQKTKSSFKIFENELQNLEIDKKLKELEKESKTKYRKTKKEIKDLNNEEKLKHLGIEDSVNQKLIAVCSILKFGDDKVTETLKSTNLYHNYRINQLSESGDLESLEKLEKRRRDYFQDRFNAHMKARNDYLADKEVEWDKRRFDSLSRLIAANSTCAAVCFDGKRILLAYNEIHDGNKNSSNQVVKQKLDLSRRVFRHLKNYAEAANEGKHDQYYIDHNEERTKLLVDSASYYYKGISEGNHPGSHIYKLAMDLDLSNGNVNKVFENLKFANAEDKVILDAIARARKDLLKLEDALTPRDEKPTLEGKERTFKSKLIQAFKEFDDNNIQDHLVSIGGNEDKVHAEMRITEHISQNFKEISKYTNNLYIGVSKLCCASCNLYINKEEGVSFTYKDNQGKEYSVSIDSTRGNHGYGYEWVLINSLKNNKVALQDFMGKQAYEVYQDLMNDDQKEKALRNVAKDIKPNKKGKAVSTYEYNPIDSDSETEIDRKNKVRARDAISTKQEADREVMDFEIDTAENKTNLTESSKKRKQVSTPSQSVENPVELVDFGDSIKVGKNSNKTIRQLNFDALEERTPKKTKISKTRDETLSGESISISPDLKKEARLIKEGLKSQSKFSPSSERDEKVRRMPIKTKQSTPEKSFSISSNFDFKFEAQSVTKDLKSQRTIGPATPLRSAKPQSPRNKKVSTPKL